MLGRAGGSATDLGDMQRQGADVPMAEGGRPAPPSNLTPILAQGQTYSAAQEVRTQSSWYSSLSAWVVLGGRKGPNQPFRVPACGTTMPFASKRCLVQHSPLYLPPMCLGGIVFATFKCEPAGADQCMCFFALVSRQSLSGRGAQGRTHLTAFLKLSHTQIHYDFFPRTREFWCKTLTPPLHSERENLVLIRPP